jgi:septum formation protein
MAVSRLILASASPRRVDLLHSLGVEFEVIPSKADELHDPSINVARLCALNAEAKAEQVAQQHPNCVVLGADTLVSLEQQLFGKPQHLDEAFETLEALSGKTHQVTTGVCLRLLQENRREVFTVETLVTFKSLTSETIRTYLRLVPVLDKAGAYGIQDRGEMLVENVRGSLSNVIGLPLEAVSDALERWEIVIPRAPGRSAARPR